jgi:uncharacterized protein (TIGR03437 family)
MDWLRRIALLTFSVAFGLGQALVSPQVTSMVFPAGASPVIYGLGTAVLTNALLCVGECPTANYPVKSSDSGQTWLPLHVFPAGTPQGVTDIGVDPSNPDIVYVSAQMNRGGIWKSIDGGQTWTSRVVGLPVGSASVDSLTVAANNGQVLYATVGGSLYKSNDGAATWVLQSNLPGGRNGKIALLPKTPTEGYYVTRSAAAFRSTDDGKTWITAGQITVQGGLVESNAVPRCVTVDPTNTNIVYVCVGVDASLGFQGIWGFWRSANAGSTWSMAYPTPQTNAANAVLADPRGIVHLQVGYLGHPYARSTDRGVNFTDSTILSPIAIDPRTPDVVWSYGANFVSRDAGVTSSRTNATYRPSFLRVTDPVIIQLEQGLSTAQTIPISTAENLTVSVAGSVTGAAWVSVPVQTATTTSGLKVNISAAGLTQGTYNANIALTSSQTQGGGTIPIRLIVNAPVPAGPVYSANVAAGGGGGEQWPSTGAATAANLLLLDQVALDPSGRIYVAGTRRVRRIESNGSLTPIAGNGLFTPTGGFNGDGGSAMEATFTVSIEGIAVDAQGRVYLSDRSANRIRVVENGIIRTEFGPGDTVQGSGLFGPQGMHFGPNGDLWVASFNGIIRIPAGQRRMELFFPRPAENGAALADVALASDGTMYFTDSGRSYLYRVRPGGPATIIAGTGVSGFNGDGLAAQVQLNSPRGLGIDAQGNVWISDASNKLIRVLGTDGYIRTVAGGGTVSFGGSGVGALDLSLSLPGDVAIDAQGNALFTGSDRLYRLSKDTVARPRALTGSFVNAGSNVAKLSPGVLFSFYGSNMAISTEVASGSPWPTILGGATVKINGTAVPLFYASPTQINGQVPYELAIGSTATATVTTNGLTSGNVSFTVGTTSPGILVFGDNRAVVVNANGAVNTAATPAKSGEVVVAYFVGTGLLDNAVPTGKAAPRDPLSRPTQASKIFVGQTETEVLFLGLTPDYIGLAQANFTIPDLPPGDYPLTISIGGVASNGPVITIGPK